ncbi:MAG TPA: hypothetical protein VJ767_10975 [Nitrososphaeraceae archaeon]|nr:hypothetical protein [Nitrososphaeraceae archaeon]
MPTKLANILKKVDTLTNRNNATLLIEFYEYLVSVRTSGRYQNDSLKVLGKFSEFINENLMDLQKKEKVLAFLKI